MQGSHWSSQYLGCFLDLLARDVVGVKMLEARHVVKNVCGIVTKQTHWIWG